MSAKPPHTPYVSLTQQARDEWLAQVRDVEPYLQAYSELNHPAAQLPARREPAASRPAKATLPMHSERIQHLPPLKQGAQDGLHAAQWRAMRRGNMPIDARLDLHGQSQQAAYEALCQQFAQSMRRGHRLLLIITGKGSISQRGVLREALPRWLNDERLRPYVLAFDTARAEDGGSGAYYVLLKKGAPSQCL